MGMVMGGLGGQRVVVMEGNDVWGEKGGEEGEGEGATMGMID